MPDPAVARFRRRALIAFAGIGVVGLGSGALANQGLARLLRLPDDAKPPTYADAEPPAGEEPGGEPVADAGGEEAADAAPARPRAPRAQSKKQYADVIVRRNIFDSTAVYNPAVEAANGDGTCTSDGNLRLLATMVVDPPEYSSALVAMGGKEGKADGYAMGEDLGTLGRIVLIEQNKVCGDGGSCVCIGGEGAVPDRRVLASKDKEEGDGDVEKLGDNKYAVEQSVLDDAMNNFEKLAGQIRVVPHKDASGQIDGYRLSAIRRGSLFDKLGIKNGDIVHGVNGNPLTSTEGALNVYQTLRNERSFSFDLTRRNQRVTMDYEVR